MRDVAGSRTASLRMAGRFIVLAAMLAAAAAAIGRATDDAIQQRVIFTKNGVTMDCRREFTNGQTYLVDCERRIP